MKTAQTLNRIALFACILVAITATATAAQDAELRVRVRAQILLNCTVTAETEVSNLERPPFDETSVPFIVEAFDIGPDAATIEVMRAAALTRFQTIRRMLDGGTNFGLTADNLERLRTQTRDSYVEDVIADFVFAFEDAALRMAGDISGTEATAFLERVARDTTSAHAGTASVLLRNRGM